jgi:hypothetical protein
MLLAMLAVTLAMPLPGPAASDRAVTDTIPEPTRVLAKEVPKAVNRAPQDTVVADTAASGETLYYLIFDGRSEQFSEESEPETILRALARRGIAIEDAWYPIVASVKVDCMAPNVYLALVVRLQAPDPRIKDLDFTTTPGRVYPNCGVEAFKHYAFD